MEYHIYLIDYRGNPHFIQKATDVNHANDCCDRYFDELWARGQVIINGTCYQKDDVFDLWMLRSDQDIYEELGRA